MPHTSLSRRYPLARTALAALCLGIVCYATPAMAQQPASPEASRLHVQAQATLEVVPDMATLNARLWERTPAIAQREEATADPQTLREARERLEQRTGELIRTLESNGVDSEAIRAGSLNIHPEYVQRSGRDNQDAEPWVRTQIERPVALTIHDLTRLPAILEALTEAGVNALDGVEYDLKDRDSATDQALTQALERAKHKAQLMARTMNVQLGQVSSIQETNAPIFMPKMMSMRGEAADSRSVPEYRPGEISIDAGVNVSWEIE
ncbi:SIMPL domain-containing protein [Halomonas sp. WWR20]